MESVAIVFEKMVGSAFVSALLFWLFWIFGSPADYAALFWVVFILVSIVGIIQWMISQNEDKRK